MKVEIALVEERDDFFGISMKLIGFRDFDCGTSGSGSAIALIWSRRGRRRIMRRWSQTLQYIKYDIIGSSKLYIKPILSSRLISADICDISASAEAILYIRYYRMGPPYIIYDIVGWAHLYHIIYTILLSRPTIYNIRYCRVGPSVPYYICDIIGWAHHI